VGTLLTRHLLGACAYDPGVTNGIAVALGAAVSSPHQSGFTLVELMVVVAIIGVLASVAMFMFGKQSNKAKASEVPAVFGEFKIRQEQYHLEKDTYLTTGADDDTLHPTVDPGKDAVAITALAAWQSLRINLDKTALYCGYVSVAGTSMDVGTSGAIATGTFGFGGADRPVPASNWFYVLAQCDFDGDDINSLYFTLSGTEGNSVENAGE
jgi:prepilin-type N-terminal cleavage/methylation domain-containing protein